LIVEDVAPAGLGALMAMLEKRRAQLAAEGLFATERKQPIPFLPEVIGVITSPSGAVIRDILHRLRDRFPRQVLIWPVAVQGEKCAPEVAAAIRGFNALPEGGPIARPDVLIVARGGGSIEDLWGFNDEAVVRAAAASRIPLISAVGHETDTTLLDHAADLRAPTPTAAAELAVPVRAELLAWVADQGARILRAGAQRAETRRQRLADLARGLGRPEMLTAPARQRFDLWADRLGPALGAAGLRKRAALSGVAAKLSPALLRGLFAADRRSLAERAGRLAPALARQGTGARDRFASLAGRLDPAFARLLRDSAESGRRRRNELDALVIRLAAAPRQILAARADRLAALDRTRQTLGHAETLARGFAVIRAEGMLVTTRAAAAQVAGLEIEFRDGRLPVVPLRPRKPGAPPEQGSLF
jgi:exodeoxyribonuclease VII large subunit